MALILCVFLPLKMSLGSTWALIECLTNLGSFSLYVIGRFAVIFFYNPQNDGVGFFKTMGFILQNDAYIF